MKALVFLFTVLPGSSAGLHAREKAPEVSSPDKAVTVRFVLKDGRAPTYAIQRNGQTLLADSSLGFVLKDQLALTQNFKIATSYQDGKDANATTNPLPVDITTQPVDAGMVLTLAKGGDTAIRFAEVK
jgi:hypothetical protein